ncbi:hypothetical protein [Promicromonospora soli]
MTQVTRHVSGGTPSYPSVIEVLLRKGTARRLVREGTAVVWVDTPESDAVDGDALSRAVRARLAHVTGEAPHAAWSTTHTLI